MWDENRYIGRNTSDNRVDTSNVTANRDGSLLERSEFIISVITGGAGDLRIQQSVAGTVEENALEQFTVSLMDIDSGAITSANINITSITQTMEKSTGGGAWSSTGITQPTFAKADGQVYCSYQFLASEWQTGDMYRLTLSGVTVTIGTATAYVPAMVWSNIVVETEDIKTDVEYLYAAADGGTTYPTKVLDNSILSILMTKDSGGDISDFDNSTDSLEAISDKITALQIDVGDPSTRTNLQSIEAMLGNPDAAGKTIYANIGDFVGNTNLQSLKDALAIPDTAGKGLYTEICTDRLDSATYGLSALNTDLDAIISKLSTGVGQPQVFIKSVTSAANAGDVTLATVMTAPVTIDAISVVANSASQTDLTSAAVYGGASKVITFLDATDMAKANIDAADECVDWDGAVRLGTGKTIVMTLAGTGSTPVDLVVTITYHSNSDGGYLA